LPTAVCAGTAKILLLLVGSVMPRKESWKWNLSYQGQHI